MCEIEQARVGRGETLGGTSPNLSPGIVRQLPTYGCVEALSVNQVPVLLTTTHLGNIKGLTGNKHGYNICVG